MLRALASVVLLTATCRVSALRPAPRPTPRLQQPDFSRQHLNVATDHSSAPASVAALLALLPTAALAEGPAPSLQEAAELGITFEPRGITPEDSVVFIIGCVPFLWATVEFWRRIAVGDSFGTGKDSVIINDTSGKRSKPLQRVLGQDAIIAARILFALAFGSAVLVLIAGVDVLGG